MNLVALALAVAVTAPGAPGAVGQLRPRHDRCFGLHVTIYGNVGDPVTFGTAGDDVIRTGPGTQRILALSGNDAICAGRGWDDIDGGGPADFDRADGGKGSDRCVDVERRRRCERAS